MAGTRTGQKQDNCPGLGRQPVGIEEAKRTRSADPGPGCPQTMRVNLNAAEIGQSHLVFGEPSPSRPLLQRPIRLLRIVRFFGPGHRDLPGLVEGLHVFLPDVFGIALQQNAEFLQPPSLVAQQVENYRANLVRRAAPSQSTKPCGQSSRQGSQQATACFLPGLMLLPRQGFGLPR